MSSEEEYVFKYYHYDPSFTLPIVAVVLFGIPTAIHCWLMARTRAWFLIPLILGGLFEVGGFAARAVSSKQTPDWELLPYIMQSVLCLVAPALFAGSIYMILGRIILMTDGESHSMIRRKWLTKIFVTGDVFSFLVQSSGAGLMSQASAKNYSKYIVIAGLIIQIVIFGFFVAVASIFHLRMVRDPTARVLTVDLPWKRHLLALYLSSALILVRSLFRTVEFAQGFDGYLFRHEVYLWVFDALLMFFVLVIFVLVRPGEIRGIIDRVERDDLEHRHTHTNGSVQMDEYESSPSTLNTGK